MSFLEFFRQVKGFYDRQEMEWKRVYVLWSIQKSGEAVSFDQFMGRQPVLSDEEKFSRLREQIEEERNTGVHVITECGELCQHRKPNSSL